MAQSKRYTLLNRQARRRYLEIVGGFHPGPSDGFAKDVKTVLLLGPRETRFWKYFETVAEYWDGKPHPMDRWSKRVINTWAERLSAQALYPFDGPPHHPFYTWALKSNRCHVSPIKLLVHDDLGLWVSFRGALALREHVELPPAAPSPCDTCQEKPCLTRCPVSALTPEGYDVDACRSYLSGNTSFGWNRCVAKGCEARWVCPISMVSGRRDAQSVFHLLSFMENP